MSLRRGEAETTPEGVSGTRHQRSRVTLHNSTNIGSGHVSEKPNRTYQKRSCIRSNLAPFLMACRTCSQPCGCYSRLIHINPSLTLAPVMQRCNATTAAYAPKTTSTPLSQPGSVPQPRIEMILARVLPTGASALQFSGLLHLILCQSPRSRFLSAYLRSLFSSSQILPTTQRRSFFSPICISLRIVFVWPRLICSPFRCPLCTMYFPFAEDPGVRALRCKCPLHGFCSCSAAEAGSLADANATSYFVFPCRDSCRREDHSTSLPILMSNTEYNILSKTSSTLERKLSGGEVHHCMDSRPSLERSLVTPRKRSNGLANK
jgi:hypothetical protein